MPVEEGRAEVRRLRLCFNCLNGGHVVQQCTARYCRRISCHRKHHSLLHLENPTTEASSSSLLKAQSSSSVVAYTSQTGEQAVLLSTARIRIKDHAGIWHDATALLDNGATPNFITARFCKKLGLSEVESEHIISGFNERVTAANAYVEAIIGSRLRAYERRIKLIVTESITCPLPESRIDLRCIRIPESLSLSSFADPHFNIPKQIDLLLGSGIFWSLLLEGRIQLSESQPVFQATHFGWIVGGTVSSMASPPSPVLCCSVTGNILNQQLQRFWDLEKCEGNKLLSKEEQACEDHFTSNMRRNDNGRYEVALPFKGNPCDLGESFTVSFKRLQSLEQRFKKNKELRESYVQFMRDYESAGHMSVMPGNPTESAMGNLLPHHDICKISEGRSKLRVVFDASCATASGRSLNDILMVGPTIQQELVDIVARFRQHPYVLIADISQMYRQIMIRVEDRRWQRILWREHPGEPVRVYELNTVTYGTASAPFLAIRCLQQLANENRQAYPLASTVLERDFYVDDMLTGATTVTELRQIRSEIESMLLSAGMRLHKWQSNVPEVAEPTVKLEGMLAAKEVRTLGPLWDPIRDEFVYQVNLTRDEVTSKRKILSIVAQIYDPLELVSPITLRAKAIMQKLWGLKVDWDGQLPDQIL